MRKSVAPLFWALILLAGAGAAVRIAKLQPRPFVEAAQPARALTVAQMLAHARLASAQWTSTARRDLETAAKLSLPASVDASALPIIHAELEPWRPKPAERTDGTSIATISAPDGAATLLRAAMAHAPMVDTSKHFPTRALGALAALEAAAPSPQLNASGFSAYGELEPDIFATHRLTILQLGDSHTAADFFSGRVRERLQQVFGTGGDAYLVPGKPHLGVRSALFDSDTTDGWSYEALQKSDEKRKFYLSGFNAVARHAGAALSLRARGGRAYDRLEVAFLKQPGGGRAEVLLDGEKSGEINLDGAPDERATLSLQAPAAGGIQGFHEISVRAVSDAAVTVTGVEVGREGDGVSYLSLGFPGATVQLLQKLSADNLADDLRRMAPDMIVLAFGTNEGFNDNLDIANYTAQYEQIVRRLMSLRPGLRVVMIGPPDAARPAGVCHAAGVGQDCNGATVQAASADGGGAQCRFPTPPKLGQVREAQRKLAQRLGAEFWDWSSVMPGPCGAQVWAAANPPLMAHDYVHMTLEGYKQSADRFADFLIPLIDGRQTHTHVVSND